METLIHADTFFFISTISIVIIAIIFIVAGYFIIKAVKDFREMVHTIKKESDSIVEDVKELRLGLKSKIHTVSKITTAATSLAFLQDMFKKIVVSKLESNKVKKTTVKTSKKAGKK